MGYGGRMGKWLGVVALGVALAVAPPAAARGTGLADHWPTVYRATAIDRDECRLTNSRRAVCPAVVVATAEWTNEDGSVDREPVLNKVVLQVRRHRLVVKYADPEDGTIFDRVSVRWP